MKFWLLILLTVTSLLSQAQQTQIDQAFVARAILTSGIENREPVDKLSNQIVGISGEVVKFYFFTQIINKKDTVITHRWLHNGEVAAEVNLNIGSENWRTYSSKRIRPEWQGEWSVQVLDAANQVIAEHSFSYAVTD